MTTLPFRRSIGRPPLRRGLLLIPLVLVCLALSSAPNAFGVSPAPDGGYPGRNTAEGDNALLSLTTGLDNTAIGSDALFSNTEGNLNTATGTAALAANTTGDNNTATGVQALFKNTTGGKNTATGVNALFSNTSGDENTASGFQALYNNTSGLGNTASGTEALFSNTTGAFNTASGLSALQNNIAGSANTAAGIDALHNNTTGNFNTATGYHALLGNTTGSSNIVLGASAGSNLTIGDNNIDIGNAGAAGESNTIRIGTVGTQTRAFIAGISGTGVSGVAVKINSSGQVGVAPSSARFKQDIHKMERASDVLLALRPVTFRYKPEIDPEGTPQFGLVAEEVEKVNRDLVVYDVKGKPYTVRYDAVSAMLLNEFLKQHRKVQEQETAITQLNSTVAKQEATITQQQKGIEVLTANLKKQAAQIQKVNQRLDQTPLLPLQVDNSR